ncbi:hypothetical protein [Streptomyces boluensis]|uniref:Uncharacterized protein n=1 Tax=Streptomyces boluensis TaxID=1775135 RepID=A0A964UMZ7_9ACTN|nr:hypothetical protein [Streptomyces boluensis]NBE49907.1 hypothetical protein [Streptomyces boluensis]
MGTKKPPEALLELLPAVHTALERHGVGAGGYTEERLRRDRMDQLIPLPGRGGVTDEEAEQAMFLAALARSKTGHLCPGVRWYLLALSPEPQAAEELRGQLEQALDRMEKRGFKMPKLATKGEKNASEHLDGDWLQAMESMRQFVVSLASHLEEADESVETLLSELLPSAELDPRRRSSAASLRDVGKILSSAFGRPMSQEEMGRIFETQAKACSMMLPLVDAVIPQQAMPASAARMTDPAYVRGLLRSARVSDLRAATLKFYSPGINGLSDRYEYADQQCKPASDADAWTLCALLEPSHWSIWQLAEGDSEGAMNHMLQQIERSDLSTG